MIIMRSLNSVITDCYWDHFIRPDCMIFVILWNVHYTVYDAWPYASYLCVAILLLYCDTVSSAKTTICSANLSKFKLSVNSALHRRCANDVYHISTDSVQFSVSTRYSIKLFDLKFSCSTFQNVRHRK